MRRESRGLLSREITFVTHVLIYIRAERVDEGGADYWRIKRVVVDDENVNLDPKHVRAQDANGKELPKDNLAINSAFNAVNENEWPTWDFGW